MAAMPTPAEARAVNISIFGAGAGGTALAIALAPRHNVLLWCRNPQTMRELAARRENAAYLPGLALPAAVAVSADFGAAVAQA